MKKYKLAVFIVLAVSLIYTKEILASYNIYNLYYVYYDEDMKEKWNTESVSLEKKMDLTEQIKILFNTFFKSEKNCFIPENVRLLDVFVTENLLILNVSDDIKNYGGAFYERALKKQLVKTALDINGIDKVTLLIDNKLMDLPEGLQIKEEQEWQGLMDETMIN